MRFVQRAVVAVLAASTMIALLGCPGSLENPERFASTCGDVPSTILTPKCATTGCHTAAAKSQGLDLESPDVGQRLLGVRSANTSSLLLDPDRPETSTLYTKVTTPITGARMPLYAPNLDTRSSACILDWIRTFSKPIPNDASVVGDGSAVDSSASDASEASDQ